MSMLPSWFRRLRDPSPSLASNDQLLSLPLPVSLKAKRKQAIKWLRTQSGTGWVLDRKSQRPNWRASGE